MTQLPNPPEYDRATWPPILRSLESLARHDGVDINNAGLFERREDAESVSYKLVFPKKPA